MIPSLYPSYGSGIHWTTEAFPGRAGGSVRTLHAIVAGIRPRQGR